MTITLGTVVLLVAGCAPGKGEFGALGAEGCDPASPVAESEIEATGSTGVTAFGWLQSARPDDLRADGAPHKLVVRMTGSGFVEAHLVAPDGSVRELEWGPEFHAESNYDRPGAEWGVGFSFDEPGCWGVKLTRGESDTATFWLAVAPE